MQMTEYQTRLLEGYLFGQPTTPGTYSCACSESDHKPYDIYVHHVNDELCVTDDEVGTLPVGVYDGGLTGCLYLLKCNEPKTHKCNKTPSGGWGTMKCGKPLADGETCDCDQVMIF